MNEVIWNKFIEKETKKGRFPGGKRKYLHFDRKINFTSSLDYLRKYLSNSKNVAQKSFYPFLKQIIATPKYKYDNDLGKRRMDVKEREICYAGHFDSLIYSYYASILDQKYEKIISKNGISNSITAYRKLGKSNIDFAKEAFTYIKSKGECVAFAFDVSGFFDNLDHLILKEAWCKVLGSARLPEDHFTIYKTLTNFAYVNREAVLEMFNIIHGNYPDRICDPKEFRENVRKNGLIKSNPKNFGIPQGSPMSAILSNVYMHSFDKQLSTKLEAVDGLYRRYSDDILIVVDPEKATPIKDFFYKKIKEFGLKSKKESIRYFKKSIGGSLTSFDSSGDETPIQYLGFIFDGERTLIRSSSISRYYRKMRDNAREAVKKTLVKGSKDKKVSKRKLYKKFTHKGAYAKGNPNFISYVYKASREMDEKEIRSQVSNHVQKLNKTIEEKYEKMAPKKRSHDKE